MSFGIGEVVSHATNGANNKLINRAVIIAKVVSANNYDVWRLMEDVQDPDGKGLAIEIVNLNWTTPTFIPNTDLTTVPGIIIEATPAPYRVFYQASDMGYAAAAFLVKFDHVTGLGNVRGPYADKRVDANGHLQMRLVEGCVLGGTASISPAASDRLIGGPNR